MEKSQDNDKKNKNPEILEKVKIFSNNKEETENAQENPKSEEINTIIIKEEIIENKSKDKNKEKVERMNKALKRIKKKREKSSEEENKKRDKDIKFKSVRIKHMANLLEEKLNINNNDEDTRENKVQEDEEINENENKDTEEITQNGKVIIKKKIMKKKFEE